ncbi:MAG: hypothetical protein J0H01_21645 [Rhizobiales bacterium]|nr:hypothetical protein [Hyphomicrobiales bacterium]
MSTHTGSGAGFLAIWSDVTAEEETDYLHWLTREHAAERVGIEGFLGVRVFRARLRQARRYFILYRLRDASVMASAGYLARLNAPTPWSSRIMPILKNFARGGGAVLAETGQGSSGLVAPIVLGPEVMDRAGSMVQAIGALDRITACRLLAVDAAGTTIRTAEKGLRADDRSFAGLLLIEALDEQGLGEALARAATVAAAADAPLLYDQVFTLDRRDLGGQAAG